MLAIIVGTTTVLATVARPGFSALGDPAFFKHGVGERLEAGDGQQADLRARGLADAVLPVGVLPRLRAIGQRIASSCRVGLYEVG